MLCTIFLSPHKNGNEYLTLNRLNNSREIKGLKTMIEKITKDKGGFKSRPVHQAYFPKKSLKISLQSQNKSNYGFLC